jgi:GTP-binding protein
MIVGENSRSGDMDVNATKEKKLTNIRTHSPRRVAAADAGAADHARERDRVHRGRRARRGDAASIRLRKRMLSQHDRRREAGKAEELRRAGERDGATLG